jgi:hypothetical protein
MEISTQLYDPQGKRFSGTHSTGSFVAVRACLNAAIKKIILDSARYLIPDAEPAD